MSFQREIVDRLGRIDVQLGIYNHELMEHVKRSTMLEERMIPVEKHVDFISKLAKLVLAVVTAGAAIIGTISMFKK